MTTRATTTRATPRPAVQSRSLRDWNSPPPSAIASTRSTAGGRADAVALSGQARADGDGYGVPASQPGGRPAGHALAGQQGDSAQEESAAAQYSQFGPVPGQPRPVQDAGQPQQHPESGRFPQFAESLAALSAPVPADANVGGQWPPVGPQPNQSTGGYPAHGAAQSQHVYQDQSVYYGNSRPDAGNGAATGTSGYQTASTGGQPVAPGAGDGYAYPQAGHVPNGYAPNGDAANGYAGNGYGHPAGDNAGNGYSSENYGNNGQGHAPNANGANGYAPNAYGNNGYGNATNGNGNGNGNNGYAGNGGVGQPGTGGFPAPGYPSSGAFPVNGQESNGYHANGQQPEGYQASAYNTNGQQANGQQANGYVSVGAPGTGAGPANGQVANNGHSPNNGQGASAANTGEYRAAPGGPQSAGVPTFTPAFSPNGAAGSPNGPATSRNHTAGQAAAANGNGNGNGQGPRPGQRPEPPSGPYQESPSYPQAPRSGQGEPNQPYQPAPNYPNGAGYPGTGGYPPANAQAYPPAPQPDWRDGYQAAAPQPAPGYPGGSGQGYHQDQPVHSANGADQAADGHGAGRQTGPLAADHPSSPGYAPPDRFDPSQQGYWQ